MSLSGEKYRLVRDTDHVHSPLLFLPAALGAAPPDFILALLPQRMLKPYRFPGYSRRVKRAYHPLD